jgi:hypothetical protein
VSPTVVRAGIDEDPPGIGLDFLRFSSYLDDSHKLHCQDCSVTIAMASTDLSVL